MFSWVFCVFFWVLWHFTKKELRCINRKINLVSRAHSWWVSEPEIKLFLGPAQGSRVEGKTAWGTHLSLQLQTPFLFIYIPLLISLSCKKATQITYFYKACFPETPISYCPSSCHLCQNNYCKKRDRRSPTVYSEGRSSLFWKLCGGYFLLFFG